MLHHPFTSGRISRRTWLAAAGGAAWGMSHLVLCERDRLWGAAPDSAIESGLLVRSADPLNAEPPLGRLVRSEITPVADFFIRSHGATPQVDAGAFRLSIEGLVKQPLSLTLAQLKEQFPRLQTTATLTCAGNRRQEHSRIRPVAGVAWDAGAIGNARWGGVRLSDVLKRAGLKDGAAHVWFEGLDQVALGNSTTRFGGSIPLKKALDDTDESPGAMIALEMNGQPLSPDHGSPARTIVPGYIGARSVKWLTKITVSDRPSENHFLAHAYKVITSEDPAELDAADPIFAYPINAAICQPAAEDLLRAGPVVVRGYALPSGRPDRTIQKVEVSADGGRTWEQARLDGGAKSEPFVWRLWEVRLNLPAGKQELIARAVDSAGQAQPQRVDWNLKGYLFNAWHRVPVRVQ